MKNFFLLLCFLIFSCVNIFAQGLGNAANDTPFYQYKETRDLVSLVKNAASLVKKEGEAAFLEFKKFGSKWQYGNAYIFILDTEGNMVLHPDSALEGKNQIDLKDVNNKFIIRGLIKEAMTKNGEGWFHYQWPEPGNISPLWKSTFVKLVTAPSGKKYIVCSGLYNMSMEREFIVEVVDSAAELINKEGKAAFPKIRDKAGPFVFLDTYVFVDSPDGIELVNAAFPSMEGRNLMDYKDSQGKYLVRDYIKLALTNGAGWIDYLWPKPGQTVPSKKRTYVREAKYDNEIFIVGSGSYLE